MWKIKDPELKAKVNAFFSDEEVSNAFVKNTDCYKYFRLSTNINKSSFTFCIKVIEELEAAFEVSPIFHRPNKKGTPLKATFYAGSGERVIACVMPKFVRTTETYAAMKACCI